MPEQAALPASLALDARAIATRSPLARAAPAILIEIPTITVHHPPAAPPDGAPRSPGRVPTPKFFPTEPRERPPSAARRPRTVPFAPLQGAYRPDRSPRRH